MSNTAAPRWYRALVFVATVLTVALGLFLADANLSSKRKSFQESDYIMTFFVAGKLVTEGRTQELYPDPAALTFVNSPFDRAAHEFLPHLPKASAGAYMYMPLVAFLFVPLSKLDPNTSLFVWQLLSVLALALSCYWIANVNHIKISEQFFLSFLFAPVFLTLWVGQLGLVLGLLPLTGGYLLAMRGHSTAAGMVWSLLILKPQYFLAGAFIALVLAMIRQYRCFFAMAAGVVFIVVANIIIFDLELTVHWLASHRVSDAMYSSGQQAVPAHLVTGLPANILLLLPFDVRSAAKLPLYAGAALIWAGGFLYLWKFWRRTKNAARFITLAYITGALLSALTMPHLLYYDLCVLLPVGYLVLANAEVVRAPTLLRMLVAVGWIAVTGFFPILLANPQQPWPPFLLEVILLILTVAILWRLQRNSFATPAA